MPMAGTDLGNYFVLPQTANYTLLAEKFWQRKS